MQAVRPLARPLLKSLIANQNRQMSVIQTKPLVRISFAEKMVHAFVITASCSVVPIWVLVNIRNYRGLNK